MSKAIEQWPHSGPQYFPAGDPRQGAYEPGVQYRIPEDISEEKASALVEGGGFRIIENEEPTPSKRRRAGGDE